MEAAFASIGFELDGLAALDLAVMSGEQLQRGVLAMQAVIDRERVIQSRWLAEADERNIASAAGHRDMASWLAAKGKTSKRAANKQARLGKALNAHPELADAVDAGTLSPDAADALAPTLDGEHSGNTLELVQACAGATPDQARAAGHRFRELNPPHGQSARDREEELRQKRALRFSDNGDGTTRVDGTLTNFDARTVQDALRGIIGKPLTGDDRTFDQKMADALVQLCTAQNNGGVKGGRSNLPTILITIDINDLNGHTNGPGYTSRGDVIPAEAIRNMTWNANLQRILLDDSKPLDIGRASRLATDSQWRALAVRDGGCRGEDCPIPPEWCEVDHIDEWHAQHGFTDIDRLVLWCIFHHHFRHRPGVELIGDGNNLAIRYPDGRIVPLPPRGPTHASKNPQRKPSTNSGPSHAPTDTAGAHGADEATDAVPANGQANLFDADTDTNAA